MSNTFWLSDQQFRRLQPLLPTDTRGVARVDQIEAQGCFPNILPKSNRKWKNCFSPYLYRGRNAIERMFSRLKERKANTSIG